MNANETPAHKAEIHVRAMGKCPVCHVAQAETFEDLMERLEQAMDMTRMNLDTEHEALLSKLK